MKLETMKFYTIMAYNSNIKEYLNYSDLTHNHKFSRCRSPVIFSDIDLCRDRLKQLKKLKCNSHLKKFVIQMTTKEIVK